MSLNPKFCKDCANHIPSVATNTTANYDKCKATLSYNLVTGEPHYKYCEYLRRTGSECGLEGSLFVSFSAVVPTPEDEAFNALEGSKHV